MAIGFHADRGDSGNTEANRADGAAGCGNNNTADVDVGAACASDEAGNAEGGDSAEPVDGDADREAEPESHSLYDKVTNFNEFIDKTVKGLDPISSLVWLTLFRFARGGIAWASQETIATRLGLSSKTVYRHIAILKEKRLLRVVKQGHRGGRCNTYQLGILPLEPVAKRPERSKSKPR